MIREHFNTDGKPKKAYPSRISAELAAVYYDQESYECSFCGKWHNGNKKEVK